MPPVKPLAPRHYSEDVGNKLVITIPSRKNWFIIIFLGIWLTGWTFGGIMAGGSIIVSIINNSKFDGPFPFIFISLIFWTVGWVFATSMFLWQLTGKEEIEVTSYSITLSIIVILFRRSKEYVSEHTLDLRVSPMGMNEMYKWPRSLAFYGIGGGIIVFDYGAGTIRVGSGIDEAEGKQIIAEIQQKYPQYKKRII